MTQILFASDLAQAYIKFAQKNNWKSTYIKKDLGKIYVEISGKDVDKLFQESGGHRIQRVPPTERKGRVHTSTVTVAVLQQYERRSYVLKDSDLKLEWFSGTGCGGQHKNKHQNSLRLIHIPTGMMVKAETRSRENSLRLAKESLLTRLQEADNIASNGKESLDRKQKVGSGMRGDKIRTLQFTNNIVTDHRTGKKMSVDKFMKGFIDDLWDSN